MRELDFILRQTVIPRVSEKCLNEGFSSMYCLQASEVSQEKMTFAASVVAVILGVVTSLICVYFLIASTLSFSFVNVVCIAGLVLGLMSCLYPVYMLAVQAFARTTKFLQTSNALKQEIAGLKSDVDRTKICLIAEGSGCFNAAKAVHSLSYPRIAFAAIGIISGIGFLIAGVCLSATNPMHFSCNRIIVLSFVFSALGIASISGGFSAFKVHMLSSEALGWLQLLVLSSCFLLESKTSESSEKLLEEANGRLSDMMLTNSKQQLKIDFLENRLRDMMFSSSVKKQVGAAQGSSWQRFRKMVAQGSSTLSDVLSNFSQSVYSSIQKDLSDQTGEIHWKNRLIKEELAGMTSSPSHKNIGDVVDGMGSISLNLSSIDDDLDSTDTSSESSEEYVLCNEFLPDNEAG
ncbi:ABC-2 family transporter protein [Chlamydiifrater phoenicopteri]|uniref:ABC-2 family transporter protein n=1 Tax=Chlamydiifrater phoenicopteri TaxID=2681469 RepID=UPI001BCAD5D1|nr:ABC-2 family transporter protein [Chlamydiifrater phoenicopteri]